MTARACGIRRKTIVLAEPWKTQARCLIPDKPKTRFAERTMMRAAPVFAHPTLALLIVFAFAGGAHAADTIARWSMDPADDPSDGQNPVVDDQAVSDGPNHLWTFNGRGDTYSASSITPPDKMVADTTSAGDYSYNAEALDGFDGSLLYPQDVYGNEFSFSSSFTVEMFFKTTDANGNGLDRSGEGFQQLINQGENGFRFGLVVNEGGPGNVRWALSNDSRVETIDINQNSGKNYADGNWHYVQASYRRSGITGAISLLTISQDGSQHEVTKEFDVADAFLLPPDQNDGNMFIGRNTFQNSVDPRNFDGLIDEVRISSGLVGANERLGTIPEPQSAALLLGGAWLCCRGRRRHRC
jgi:hypothetical protein